MKCIVVLGVVWRAILVSQGGPEPAELATAALARAVPLAKTEIATRVDAYCRGDPAACLADAMRLTDLVSASAAGDGPRQRRRMTTQDGAVAAQAR